MPIEISFPRGGKKPPTHKTAIVSKVQYDLFGKKKPKHKNIDLRNEMGLKKFMDDDICPEEIIKTTADLPSYRTIQEGMVIMGAIREIQKMALSVLLPGRITGRVMITQISAPYTKLLRLIAENITPDEYHPAREIFHPGQYVATKVVKINNDDEKSEINLSMAPQDVNSELNYQTITTGMLLWGAISGCEEHGYVIDLGISHCRAFLPKANIDDNNKYIIGEVLWCYIQKCEITGVASTVTINTKTSKIESMKTIKDLSLDRLLPGMQVDFTITKILINGLEGRFLNNYLGYVHEAYLRNILDKPRTYKVDQVVSARIMYITPVTKLTYMTLRGLYNEEKVDLKDGTLVNCSVLNITRGGLYIKINKIAKGYVSFKRLKKPLSVASDLTMIEIVQKSYQPGSCHACRILSYDYMEKIYTCTMEKDLLKEQVFGYADLKAGQNVTVDVIEIQKNGLLVQAGRLTGFILNEHLSDNILLAYNNIKTKFNVGQKLKTKVWKVNEENNSLHFTIKPSFLSAVNCLTSYEEAEHNKQFLGEIVQITRNGVLVIFFGNVKGWIPKNQLSFEKVNSPELMFKIGQIVNCTVLKCNINTQKLTLSLQPPKHNSKRKKLRLGQHVNVKVTAVLSMALEVEVIETKVGAIIPAQHLTSCPSMAELMLETYSEGDIIKDLVCVNSGRGVSILSIRERELNEENVIDVKQLKSNMLVRCSVNSVNEKCMLLQCPIKAFSKLIVIPTEDICDINKKPLNIDIKKNQYIYAKIKKVSNKTQTVLASTKLSVCWDGDVTITKNLFLNYLSDLKRIKQYWENQENSLTKYNPGEIISGTVATINKNGSVVLNLPNDVIGKVNSRHSIKGIAVGDEVKGVVLSLNYKQNYMDIAIKTQIISRINQKQNGEIKIQVGKNAIADILLIKKEYVLVALRGNGNRQLAYLPVKLHPNDLLPNTRCYKIGEEIKIKILHIENGQIIGISKELIKTYEKKFKANKRARPISESSQDGTKNKKQKLDKKIKTKKNKKQIEINETNIDNEIKDEEMEADVNEESEEQMEIDISENDSAHEENENEESAEDEIENEESENEDSETESNLVEDSEAEEEPVMEIKTEQNKKQQKIPVIEVAEEKEGIEEINNEHLQKKSKKNKKQNKRQLDDDTSDNKIETKSKKVKYNDSLKPILSGVNGFWDTPATEKLVEESSEDEEKKEDVNKKQKKKKLTPAERAELAREEEERLRKIETELADADAVPKTADQFDRLVMVSPNSSMLWINYIAFHLEATEIEKARAVARKALNTIEFREEQEKLNIWIAFLNLENRYGSKESFSSILEEGIKMNDSLTVHLQALNILAESNKTTEFLELLGTVSRRYKQDSKMWTEAAEACYKCDQKDQARNLMQRAVKSLDEKQHINLIVQFAFMESKWGEPERAEAILEKVLASYPRRVDVWCSYIDMLIKGNRIHIAKNVLERAVSQKLPPRKMKTIFTKFIQFETKFGDEESVKKVRQLASDYVKDALK